MVRAKLVQYFISNPRRLFMVDAFGAAVTAVAIGLIMQALPQWFMVQLSISYALAGIAMVFSLYSALCGLALSSGFKPYILAIAMANTLYCIATAGILLIFFEQFSVLASIYFLLEICVIIILVFIELTVYRIMKNDSNSK